MVSSLVLASRFHGLFTKFLKPMKTIPTNDVWSNSVGAGMAKHPCSMENALHHRKGHIIIFLVIRAVLFLWGDSSRGLSNCGITDDDLTDLENCIDTFGRGNIASL